MRPNCPAAQCEDAALGQYRRQTRMRHYPLRLQALQLEPQSVRRPLRRLSPGQGGKRGVGASSRAVPAQRLSTRLRCRQCRSGSLADQLPAPRRLDPHHQVIRARHVRRSDRNPILQQLRQRVGAAREPLEPRRDQHCAELPAA